MSPLAKSPPSSTPEPELGSIPQDAAIVPHPTTPQVLSGNTRTHMHILTQVKSSKLTHLIT